MIITIVTTAKLIAEAHQAIVCEKYLRMRLGQGVTQIDGQDVTEMIETLRLVSENITSELMRRMAF